MKSPFSHKWLSLLVALLILSVLGYAAASWLLGKKSHSGSGAKAETLFEAMGVSKPFRDNGPLDAQMFDLQGRQVGLSEFRGKVVFLNFWATWCPPCRAESASLDRLFRTLKNDAFAMVAVSIKEPAETVRAFLKSEHLTFPVFLDPEGKMGRQFSVRSIPATYILNSHGSVIGTAMGARRWDSHSSIALFKHLIKKTSPP